MNELLRAVKRTLSNHNTYSDVLNAALSATIAEFKKRREDGGTLPFTVRADAFGGYKVSSQSGADWSVSLTRKAAREFAAALNAYYGYGPNGEDWTEEI